MSRELKNENSIVDIDKYFILNKENLCEDCQYFICKLTFWERIVYFLNNGTIYHYGCLKHGPVKKHSTCFYYSDK